MPINSFLYPATQVVTSGYEVANSLRFNDGSSDYLTKSFGTTQTSTAKFTVSVWVKRCTLGTRQSIFAAYSGGAAGDDLEFETDDTLSYNGSGAGANTTSAKFRDVSAWYHIVLARDSSASGASNQVKIYVNGILQSLSTNSGCNTSQFLKNGLNSRIGTNQGASQYWVDMYMAELCVIDGQQLDATSFGEFDEDSGIWKPIDVSGLTFGNNGFYLDFENSGSLGADVSGNGNNFTVNNLTSIDQTTDTCTNNFATLNSLNTSTSITISEGNTKITTSTSNWFGSAGTIGITKGFPCYWEAKATTNTRIYFGLSRLEDYDPITGTTTEGQSNLDYMWRASSANLVYYRGSNQSVTVSAVSAGDILACSVDSSGNVTFYNNGSAIHTFSTVLVDGYFYFPILSVNGFTSTETMEANFGNPAFSISSGNTDANGYGNFEYAPPSNHYALNTKNLAEYG